MGRIVTIKDGKQANAAEIRKAQGGPKIDKRSGSDVDSWLRNEKWVKVKSSNVAFIKYEKPIKRLWVRFKGGAEYSYSPISTMKARSFYLSASMGKAVWKLRREGWVGIRMN